MSRLGRQEGFAIWITGLPASGKSSITHALVGGVSSLGLEVEVLESDRLRIELIPNPTYAREERDLFYRAMAYFGTRLTVYGVNVIFDATANRREYRDIARRLTTRFLEVLVQCPLDVCKARDKKGTYQKAAEGSSKTVPGVQEDYEPPLSPDMIIQSSLTV